MRRINTERTDTATGKGCLKIGEWSNGFVAAKDETYGIVRSMSAALDRE